MEFNERLQLFNSKVELLSQRSFFGHLTSQPTNVRLKWDRDTGWESSFAGPADESIEASVLTIRQFMQDNDPISIRNVANSYVTSGVDQSTIDEYQKVRGWLNDYLDRESNLGVAEGKQLTNREILFTFVYGGLAHSSEPYHSRYRGLMGSPFASLLKVLFVEVLGKFMSTLRMLATVNRRVINPEGTGAHSPPADDASAIAPSA
ncbi:MAG: hypothetical protein WEA80_10710 [Gemmatimonadaceae bacterium]